MPSKIVEARRLRYLKREQAKEQLNLTQDDGSGCNKVLIKDSVRYSRAKCIICNNTITGWRRICKRCWNCVSTTDISITDVNNADVPITDVSITDDE